MVVLPVFIKFGDMHGLVARLLYKCLILIGERRIWIMGVGSCGATSSRVEIEFRRNWISSMGPRMGWSSLGNCS
jgi:hypothetical protein